MVIMQNEITPNMSQIRQLSSQQDVATLLDVFEDASQRYASENIVDMFDDGRAYYAVVTPGMKGSFDLFQFINSRYSGNEEVNCINAKLLFPKMLSRGIGSDALTGSSRAGMGVAIPQNSDFLDDAPTGFMGESEVSKLTGIRGSIVYRKMGISCEIPEFGLVIGRSAKKSDFLIRGNSDISRAHCKVYPNGGKFYVRDMNSLNGTFLNRVKIKPEQDAVLKSGDIILLAGEEIEVL